MCGLQAIAVRTDCEENEGSFADMKKKPYGEVGKKVLASALSAAMVVAFAPAVAMAGSTSDGSAESGVEAGGTEGGSGPAEAVTGKIVDAAGTALTAENNDITITTSGNYRLTGDVTADVVVNQNVEATIDLVGHKLTNVKDHTILNKGKLTVKDSSGSGVVDNLTHGKGSLVNEPGASAVLNGGTFTRSKEAGSSSQNDGGNSWYTIKNYGSMSIYEGATVTTGNNNLESVGKFSSLVANGWQNPNDLSAHPKASGQTEAVLHIYGGNFSGGINTVKNDDYSLLQIENGYFANYTQAAFQNHGKATVNNGTFDADSQYAVYNCPCGDSKDIDPGELSITGGTFKGKVAYVNQNKDWGSLEISGGTFTDIASAVKYAATKATLTMGADATANLVIPAGKDITLDLNGKKLTNAGDHTITNKGTLTVCDSAADKSGVIDNTTHAKATVYNMGICNLKAGTFERSEEKGVDSNNNGGNSYYTVLNHGNMTIADDVTINNNGHYSSLFENGYFDYKTRDGVDNPSLVIDGGAFNGGLNTIKNDDGANLIINRGTFKNYTQAAFQNHGTAQVSGGTFNAESKYSIDNCGCDKTIDPGKLTITGGSFNGTLNIRSPYSDVSVTGGTFNGAINKTDGKLAITGGTFSVDPSAYLASGYSTYKSGENWVVYYPSLTPTPTPEPKPEPTPVAPGTDVSGTDEAGNTVDATVTDTAEVTLPDGTKADGSVEYKGTTTSGTTEPATEVSVPSTVTTSDGSTYVVTKIADEAFEGQEQLSKVTIPETVVEIGDRAFANTSIESVVIPAATTAIGAGVFQGCDDLKSVDISKAAITEIPADAFNGTSIGAIEIPATVTTVGERAFKGTALTAVELPKAVKEIAKSTFENCASLKSVTTSATTVGYKALAGCTALKSVDLSKATELGKYAMKGDSKLKTVSTGTKLKAIGYKALAGTKVKTLTVSSKKLTPASVKGSLKGSAVKKVEVAVSGSKKTVNKYVAKYKRAFKKSNSGKSVTVVAKKAK